MAQLLSDREIRGVLGSIIKDGDADSERPDGLYTGAYQGKTGYVRSERSGAPAGMRPRDWEDSTTKEGPEALLEALIQSGFPWNVLGTRLKAIDDQFQTVTNEYADIRESVRRLEDDMRDVRRELAQVPDKVRGIVKDEQHRWLGGAAGVLIGLAGVVLAATKSPLVGQWLDQHGDWIGASMAVGALVIAWMLFWRRR